MVIVYGHRTDMEVHYTSNLPPLTPQEFLVHYLQAVCLMGLIKVRRDAIFCCENGCIDTSTSHFTTVIWYFRAA